MDIAFSLPLIRKVEESKHCCLHGNWSGLPLRSLIALLAR